MQWEMWLKSDELPRNEVNCAESKHRCIVCLAKKVGRRNKGMGMKVAKFHQIMHTADDILNFGVPMEVDTGANESGHVPTKKRRCHDDHEMEEDGKPRSCVPKDPSVISHENINSRKHTRVFWMLQEGVLPKGASDAMMKRVFRPALVDPLENGKSKLLLCFRTPKKQHEHSDDSKDDVWDVMTQDKHANHHDATQATNTKIDCQAVIVTDKKFGVRCCRCCGGGHRQMDRGSHHDTKV